MRSLDDQEDADGVAEDDMQTPPARAEEAAVSKGGLFYHFPSKEALVQANAISPELLRQIVARLVALTYPSEG